MGEVLRHETGACDRDTDTQEFLSGWLPSWRRAAKAACAARTTGSFRGARRDCPSFMRVSKLALERLVENGPGQSFEFVRSLGLEHSYRVNPSVESVEF